MKWKLENRKYRKGAEHTRLVRKNSTEKHKRDCNICGQEFVANNKFIRFCDLCRQEEEYRFGYDLSTFGAGNKVR